MRALLQRVSSASVCVDAKIVGEIDQGLLILLGVQRGDTRETANKLVDKIVNYRMFNDIDNKMNLSVKDISGGLLIVSQFTLAADTDKGRRPGFSSAAEPDRAKELYDYCIMQAQLLTADKISHVNTATKEKMNKCKVAMGIFGADMKVSLTNDGPVTFMLEVKPDA
jgi:D-tyrosyl-tRNA(Tyr) deacylase